MKNLVKSLAAVIAAAVLCMAFVPSALASDVALSEGDWSCEVTMTGGSGKATITSPTLLQSDGENITATIEWSSPYYDYMIVDGERYLPVNEGDTNSVFEIPVTVFDEPITVIGDTTAMGAPHEIEYQLTFDSNSIGKAGGFNINRFIPIAVVIILVILLIVYRRLRK